MSLTVLLVVLFGFAAIVALFSFGICKLQRTWKDKVCICAPEHKGPCKEAESCNTLQEINADFLSRRNELLLGLGQGIVIAIIITLLAVLLLENKITAEAAVPIMAVLGSLGFGKTIAAIKDSTTPKKPPPIVNKQETDT